ncbi:MAG: hypothetical protein IIY33_02535, partial [Erysipelotrichaceae bacterium]|nr:hypothetical protein [Erysipelotrichaceae bacterium]
MKKIIIVTLAVFMMLACFGCSKEEVPVDETPLIDLIKGIEPTTMGFYTMGESQNIDDYKDAKFIVANPIKTSEDAALDDLKNSKRWDNITVENKDSVLEAINAFIAEGDEKKILVLNNAYIDTLKGNELVGGLLDSVKPVHTYDAETAYDYSL